MVNWKNEAIEKLRQYGAMAACLKTIPLEIKRLELDATKICSADPGKVVDHGGGNGEDALLANISKRQELANRLRQAAYWVDTVEKALDILCDEYRAVLERLYMTRQKGTVDRLCYELGLEQSSVYRRRDAALKQFTMALFGAP